MIAVTSEAFFVFLLSVAVIHVQEYFGGRLSIVLIKNGGSSGGTKRGFGGSLLSMFLSNQIGELL